jgi:uncharacterized protein (DUF3084 family)
MSIADLRAQLAVYKSKLDVAEAAVRQLQKERKNMRRQLSRTYDTKKELLRAMVKVRQALRNDDLLRAVTLTDEWRGVKE